jgi:acyl-CoA synthetase (AMP-forming)/AMP-acid ligase II
VYLPESLATDAATAPALGAPGRPDLSHEDLHQLIGDTVTRLNQLGIGRNDGVAILLPNGPEMAASFLAVAAGASTAPLNPAYREDELDFYLSDIGAKAILVGPDEDGPAVKVAAKLGIAVIHLTVETGAPAGAFAIEGMPIGPAVDTGFAEIDDVALYLYTSGTTSRPRLVPLSHRNIAASARNIGEALGLVPKDRCLNIMPLFHIHGLIAAVLSSVASGGSVFCTPGFDALRFYRWLEEAKPTWYTAVPTMHQAILARASRNPEVVAASKLRFVRSSSASLPPQVMLELEETFSSPVIESYGMTEAAEYLPNPSLKGCSEDR